MKWTQIILITAAWTLATFAHAQKAVLGTLAQTLESAPIYSKPSSNSRVYYKTKQYQYIIVNKDETSEKYLKVLLQNGRHGYIYNQLVAELPYNVTSDKTYTPSRSGSTVTAENAQDVAQASLQYIGTPYKWGGNDVNNGIDCSGFVKQMYGQIGVNLPRTAAEQVKVGKPIARLEDLQAGDRLYFWDKKRGKVGHTGIYLGGGYFVHSSVSNGGVATNSLGEKKWLNMLVAARR